MSARYAIYFSPGDGSELAVFGQSVLGRNAEGCAVATSSIDYPDRQYAIVLSEAPSFYGFHATLKAPFVLSALHDVDTFLQAVDFFSREQLPIDMIGLAPVRLADFFALSFENQPETIATLARSCVQHFEPYREPLTAADMQRRSLDVMTVRQREHLEKYGYPYVMDDFRFHMTLSGNLSALGNSPKQQLAHFEWLNKCYSSSLSATPILDRVCVYWQPDRTQPFVRLEEFPLSGNQRQG